MKPSEDLKRFIVFSHDVGMASSRKVWLYAETLGAVKARIEFLLLNSHGR
jgi:hypothetical protein